mgnify:CR=1 FL=1
MAKSKKSGGREVGGKGSKARARRGSGGKSGGRGKSPYATGAAFSVDVSDAIRHHVGKRVALETKRKNAMGDRDAALDEKHGLSNKAGPAYREASLRHSDAVELIDDLKTRINWHGAQVDELVEKADQPMLKFAYEMPDDDDDEDDGQMEFGAGEKPVRPIGKPGKAKPEAPDPSQGDGVDEHMNAAVAELQLDPAVERLLVNAGLTTVGRVAAVIDDEAQSLAEKIGDSEAVVAKIVKAVYGFRKAHRRAMAAVEKDGAP